MRKDVNGMAEVIKGTTAEELIQPVQAADMEQFQATPYYQGLGIEALRQELAGYQTDDEALRRQVEAQYKPMYDAEAEALRQQTERQVQGYESQRAGVSAAYDRARRQTQEAYDESAVDLNNALTRRGLGRSSLVSTQGAYLEKQRNQALDGIDRDENQAISAINEKIALLTDQAAQSERTMAGNYARQLEMRVNELKSQNRTASIDLQLRIAALQQQGYEAYQDWLLKNREQARKEAEFEMKYGGKSSASANGGSKKKSTAGTDKQTKKEAASGVGSVSGLVGSLVSKLAGVVNHAVKKNASGTADGMSETRPTAEKRQNAVE